MMMRSLRLLEQLLHKSMIHGVCCRVENLPSDAAVEIGKNDTLAERAETGVYEVRED